MHPREARRRRDSVVVRQLIEDHGGGVRGGWGNLKAIIPGGASCPVITREQAETVLRYLLTGNFSCGLVVI